MTNEQITKHITEEPDSLEIGTPAKGGGMKVYFNASRVEEAKDKIEKIILLRKYMNQKIEESNAL